MPSHLQLGSLADNMSWIEAMKVQSLPLSIGGLFYERGTSPNNANGFWRGLIFSAVKRFRNG